MGPKLLIVQPTNYRSKTDQTIVKARKRSVVNLTLPYLAALAPQGWDIKLVDELVEDVGEACSELTIVRGFVFVW